MTDSKDTGKQPKNLSMKSLDKDFKEATEKSSQRFDNLEKSVSGIADDVKDQLGGFLKTLSAQNNPTSITKDGTFAEDVCLNQDKIDIEFAKNGDIHADVETVRPALTSIDNAEFKDKANQMAFDNEMVKIMVMPSSSTYPDHTFSVGVNGIQRLIVRGKEQWLPRRYVEVLLRAKVSYYANIEQRNSQNELEVAYPETKSHRYPLQILEDKNPLGVKWLTRVNNDTRC